MRPRLTYASYDFANSGYVVIFQSFLFPLFLGSFLSTRGNIESLWGWTVAVSSVLAILTSPSVGKLADRSGKGRVFTSLVISCGLLVVLSILGLAGRPILLLASFVIFNALFELSQTIYDSFLVNFASTAAAKVSLSTFAWGFGYVGGAVFVATYLLLERSAVPISLMLLIFVALFLAASVPSMRAFLRVSPATGPPDSGGLRTLLRTSPPVPWKDIVVYWIIADCVAAIMYFMPLYATREIGLSTRTIGALMLATQTLAFPATVLMGRVARRVGNVRTIRFSLVVWAFILVSLFLARSLQQLLPALFLLLFVVGTTQSLLRAHYAARVDLSRSGEGLGYFAVAQKSASVLSPALVSLVFMLTGSLRYAFLLLAGLVALGLVLSRAFTKAGQPPPERVPL